MFVYKISNIKTKVFQDYNFHIKVFTDIIHTLILIFYCGARLDTFNDINDYRDNCMDSINNLVKKSNL